MNWKDFENTEKMTMAMCVQFPDNTELSAVTCECQTPSTQLRVPVKLQTITGDVHITARLELNVSKPSVVLSIFNALTHWPVT